MIIRHGLSKLTLSSADLKEGSNFHKVYINIKYFISSRFQEDNHAIEHSLRIIKVFVDNINMQAYSELLLLVSEIKVPLKNYNDWTNCVGAFMSRMGAYDFF
jgi:hypothetical protein